MAIKIKTARGGPGAQNTLNKGENTSTAEPTEILNVNF